MAKIIEFKPNGKKESTVHIKAEGYEEELEVLNELLKNQQITLDTYNRELINLENKYRNEE